MRPISFIVGQLALTTALTVSLMLGMQCALAQTTPAPADSAIKGKALYDARCSACHSVDAHRVGPMHLGVVGRKAGSAVGYKYSEALRKSKIVWNQDTLVAWLTNPEALIPGQRMGYAMDNAQDREDVVAYLATLKVSK
jgi:cytochrome c